MSVGKLVLAKLAAIALTFVGVHQGGLCTAWAAQSASATLSGTVQDATGAQIPDVEMVLVNLETGSRRQASTGETGTFTIPLLPPGRYTLTAQREGFTPASVRDIVLNVNDALMLRVLLTVAKVGESVTVEAPSATVSTSPAVGTVVDRRFIADLPLNGRSFQTLLQLIPGVVQNANTLERGQFSVNGQRAGSNYFTIDGVSANVGVQTGGFPAQGGSGALPSATVLGGSNSIVNLDALQEFSVQTSTYAPEQGRAPGAQVNIVTRSGTNDLHGSAFEYFRDSALDANDFFANRAGIPKPESRQNLFGGSFGGPIVRDSTFVFVAYEGLRLRQPQTSDMIVPSLATRQSAPAPIRSILEAYPAPNGPDLPGGVARSGASYAEPSHHNIGSLRVDHSAGRHGTFFGRVHSSRSTGTDRKAAVASNVIDSYADMTAVTLGATHIFTPTLVNSARYNVSRSVGGNRQFIDDFAGANVPPSSAWFPATASDDGFAIFNLGSGLSGVSTGVDAEHTQTQHNFVDTLSWSPGRHAVKFGVDFRQLRSRYGTPATSQYRPTYNFTSVAQAASQLLTTGIISVTEQAHLVFDNLSLFAQDTWQLSNAITLTYGLRYERNPPPRGATAGDQPFTVNSVDDLATVALAPRGTPLYQTTNANFAPRVGAAWQLRQGPRHETVLRGGWGIFYDLGTGVIASAAGAFPFLRTKRLPANTPFPLDASAATPLPIDAPPPFDLIRAFDPDIELPRVQQFNVTLEQHLGGNQSVSAAYVGARGSRLLRQESMTNTSPTIFQLQLTTNGDRSKYDAMQVQYQRRLTRGVQALASYTLSKSEDTSSTDGGFLPRSDRLPADLDYAPSDFDVRHAFNAAVSWDLPAVAPRALLSGWGLDGIVYTRSGLPLTVNGTRSSSFGFIVVRPDLIPGATLYLDDSNAPGGRRINPLAFQFPASEGHGNLPRNSLRGFGMWQVDLAVRRTVTLGRGWRVTFRGELFNAFNQANFGLPAGNLGTVAANGDVTPNANFGVPTTTLRNTLPNGLNSIYQVGGPRSAQLSLRVEF